MREPHQPELRSRLPHFAEGDGAVAGADAEAFAEGARKGYPPVSINALIATVQFETEAECIAYMARLARLPRRTLPAAPVALPPWLKAARPDADIRLFDGRHDELRTAGPLRASVEADLRRRADGWLSPEEVAELLAAAGAGRAGAIRDDLERAFDSGDLPFWRMDAGRILPMDPDAEAEKGGMHALSYYGWTRPEAVDLWTRKVNATTGSRLPLIPAGPWKLEQGQPGDAVKLEVLKKELGARWPTMTHDFNDASTNGLAAFRISQGMYSRAGVVAWAEARGKLGPVSALPSLPSRVHRSL
jgi:hypothetical protein